MTASRLASKLGKTALATEWEEFARKVRTSFNQYFWNPKLDCCFDVLADEGGNDASIRPNQLFAISLPHAVLEPDRHRAMIQRVRDELQTARGLRTLGTRDHGYQGKYAGGVVARDSAQHQGSIYPWLLGPLATAYLKTYGRDEETKSNVLQWITPCLEFMEGDGLGQLSELFDGDAPHTPRGAPAAALSAAEMLRTYARDILGISMLRTKLRPIPPSPAEPPVASSAGKWSAK